MGPIPEFELLRFLETMPATINDRVLFSLVVQLEAAEFHELMEDDRAKFLRRFMRERGRNRIIACAMIIGVLELILAEDLPDQAALLAQAKAIEEALGPDLAVHSMQASFGAPLAQRHWQQARDRLSELRAGVLSPPVLALRHRLVQLRYPPPLGRAD